MRFCSFSSGSKGNVSVFSARHTSILIDAGISARRITEGLQTVGLPPSEIAGILITHEHSDHIAGLRVFAERYRVPVYANESTMRALERTGLDMRLTRVFRTGEDFFIKDLCITPVHTSHDAAESVGYCIECGGQRFSFFTDLGYVSKQILEIASGSTLVVLESNHDLEMLKNGRYPQTLKRRVAGRKGHLSNDACADTAVELAGKNVAQIILAHISAENNRPELARETVIERLAENGFTEGKDVLVGLALQDMISPVYEIE